jgi:hypothetical protein
MTDRELLHAAIGALRNIYRLGPRPWIPGANITWPDWDNAYANAETVLAAYEKLHPEIVVVRP